MSTTSRGGASHGAKPVKVSRKTFDDVMIQTFAPSAMVPVRASGLDVWDQTGRRYLDFTAGVAVTSLGHANPALADIASGDGHDAGDVCRPRVFLQLRRGSQ
jgi:acetylornithine/succinyldiaminopimelate/putrescine aminotransferase